MPKPTPETMSEDLPVKAEEQAEPTPLFLGIFYGNSLYNDPGEMKFVYRGDQTGPLNVYKQGFEPPGINEDLLRHVNPHKEHYAVESGFVSTTTSKEVAKGFPKEPNPIHLKHSFLYEINLPEKGIDVRNGLFMDVVKGKILPENYAEFLKEKEIAVPHKIEARNIRGAWPVVIEDWRLPNGDCEKYVRTIKEEHFIPNPAYVAPQTGPQRLASAAKVLGHTGTAIAIVVDGNRLFTAFQESQIRGNFDKFFHTGSEILGGWPGAIALGQAFATQSALACIPLGIYGPPACGIAGGITGSIVGYMGGSKLGSIAYQGLKNDRTGRSFFHSIENALNRVKTFQGFSVAHAATLLEEKSYLPIGMTPESAPALALPSQATYKKKETPMPTTSQNREEFIPFVEENLEKLLTSFGRMVALSAPENIDKVIHLPGVRAQHEKIEGLKLELLGRPDDVALAAKINHETLALRAIIVPELRKREGFDKMLTEAHNTVIGAARGLSAFDDTGLAQEILTVGTSVVEAVEQASLLLTIGLSAVNPVLALGTILGAIGGVVKLFNQKQQENPNAGVIRLLQLLFEYMIAFEKSLGAQIWNVLTAVEKTRWEILASLAIIMAHQPDMLTILSSINKKLDKMHDEQNARYIAYSGLLTEILGNLASSGYRDDLNELKELLRLISTNTVFKNYNELINKLEHIGREKSSTNQLADPFLLVEGAKPASYYQLYSYYAHLISLKAGTNTTEEMRMRPGPIPLIYSSNAQMLLIATKYPKPDHPHNSSRVALRDLNQLKAFVLELQQFEALAQQARTSTVWNSTIKTFEEAASALHMGISNETYSLETVETQTIHASRVSRLALQHDNEQKKFNEEIEAETPEWVIDGTPQQWFKGKKHIHKNWYKYRGRFKSAREGSSNSYPEYSEPERRKKYLDQQNKFMRDAKEEWNIRISKFQERAANNTLLTTAPAIISAYHGARFIQSTQPDSLFLPAPDPLLSPINQTTFEEFMQVLREAQAYNLGDIELFYTTFSETGRFVIDIIFHQKSPSASPKEAIARFNITYDPLDGFPRREALWKGLVGTPEFVRPRQGDSESNSGGGCQGGDDNYNCEHFTSSLFVPKPPVKREGLLELWQKGQFQTFAHETQLTLRYDLLNDLRSDIQEARQQFTILIRERLSNSLDHRVQNHLGRLCRAFEKAYHHLFGILVYAFSDEMQNPKSALRTWFTNHAANIQQLRQTFLTEAVQYPLRKLITDLPKLRAILSGLPTEGLHFHLLSDTRAALQGFLQIYEPYAVAHNAQVPPVDMDEKVKERYNSIVLDALSELFNVLPYEQAVARAQKILDKDTVTETDHLVRDEILQRLQEESRQRGLALPAATLVPQLSVATSSPAVEEDLLRQECKDSPPDEALCDALFGPDASALKAQALCTQQASSSKPTTTSNTWASFFNRACHFVMSGGQQHAVAQTPVPASNNLQMTQ